MTDSILKKQHVSKHVLRREQNRITRSFVILSGLNSRSDEVLSLIVIRTTSRNRPSDSKQIGIIQDRTNVLLINLVVAGSQTTVTDQDRTSDFLVEHHSHLRLKPCNYVEICNIDNIVTIHLLFLINGRRSRGSLKQAEYLFFLKLSFDVSFSSCLIFCNVSKHRLNATEWGVMSLTHNLLNPAHVSLDKFRRSIKALHIRQ